MKRKDRAWAVLKGSPDERAGGNDSKGSMSKEPRRSLRRGFGVGSRSNKTEGKQSKRQLRQNDFGSASLIIGCA